MASGSPRSTSQLSVEASSLPSASTAPAPEAASPPLPDCYFGNAFITLGTAAKVRDIGSEGLACVAGRINGTVHRMDDEVVRSAIDYLEMNSGKQPAGTLPGTELRVFSWLGMPMYDADFGWGKPLTVHRAAEERGGIVYLMDGLSGGVRVLVSAEADVLNDFRRLLYAIFYPLRSKIYGIDKFRTFGI